MGFFKRRKKLTLGLRIRQSLHRALASDPPPMEEKNPSPVTADVTPADSHDRTSSGRSTSAAIILNPDVESQILLLPAELLRDIFSYLDSADLQALYDTHPRFRAIVYEHRSFLCRELAERNLRYYARYLKPAYFDLQRESRAQFLGKDAAWTASSEYGDDSSTNSKISTWYLRLCKLDRVTKELYALMPDDENEWETEYLRIQGLSPSQYNPRVWPRPGNPMFYFAHTIISFYQYNSLVKAPKDSLNHFRVRDIKPVCRCAQGYFRSTAHLGILCAVYMACLKYNTPSNGSGEDSIGKDHTILAPYLPEFGGGLGNYLRGTRVSVKELFKMVVVVMHPANLLKVIKEPSLETMSRLRIVLETLKKVLVRNEEERRRSGVARTYTKGLEMMEGFARYWEEVADEDERQKLWYFEDWDRLGPLR
ncbi:hypothetical protein Dda_2467 [Drechslerella dactyloides]|uniref:F-box domain-containing protein n=1 Tax=Drechslerella dactyloides TaxID=74499 RepID=A0AAD6NKD2_DREDA|nr:hypothetical protein Dda_2467 [Drechslerella dactyloides]